MMYTYSSDVLYISGVGPFVEPERCAPIFRQLVTDLLLGSLQDFTGWAALLPILVGDLENIISVHQFFHPLPFSWLKSACDSACLIHEGSGSQSTF